MAREPGGTAGPKVRRGGPAGGGAGRVREDLASRRHGEAGERDSRPRGRVASRLEEQVEALAHAREGIGRGAARGRGEGRGRGAAAPPEKGEGGAPGVERMAKQNGGARLWFVRVIVRLLMFFYSYA